MNTARTQNNSADEAVLDVADRVRQIEIITRRLVNDTLAGQYHAVFKGRGMSFDSVREYQPGDDVRTIDWNVSARTGGVFVKQYVEERELTVLLAVDLSGSMGFGTKDRSKRDLATEIAAVLAFSALRNNDRVGLVLFSDHIEQYVPPKKGRAHVLRMIRDLLTATPKGTRTRLDGACDYLARIVRKRSVVFLLSDFLQPDFERSLGVLARRHDLVPLAIADRAEMTLPNLGGLVALEDAETGELQWVDTGSAAVRQHYWQRQQVARRKIEQALRKHGCDPIEAWVGEDYLAGLVTYFRRRAARQ
ncbi:MAG: DUF58 domain-containing protein [Deltaproteobacteria bacterium]|nr:DUF58 domain-containing protein [Deltaproteobacteria bacterium]